MPKEAFQLGDFIIPDVVPNDERREMGPLFSLALGLDMAKQSPLNTASASSSSHADIDHAILVCTIYALEAIQDIDASQPPRQVLQPLLRDVLNTSSDEP